MATISDIYSHGHGDRPELNTNLNVDYVLHYRYPPAERDEAEAAFVQLIEALAAAGLATEVRPGADPAALLVFVRIASDRRLRTHVYRSRVQDYLYGIRTSAPPPPSASAPSTAADGTGGGGGGGGGGLDAFFADEPITEAERLRLAYRLITMPRTEGGAGLSVGGAVGSGALASAAAPAKYIVALFPLHDHPFNRRWIQGWSKKSMLDAADLDAIRDKLGERVAFYFAFLQSYFAFLLFPAAFGLAAWALFGPFSWLYAVVNSLWSVVFFEYWKKREVDLAVQWGVRGVSQIQLPRPQFRYEREAPDPVTGESVKVASPLRRLRVQLLQLPFALACVAALGSLIALCFSIEIFITELYSGPFKHYLTFLPTILLTVFMPMLTGALTNVAERLTVLENYETQDSHQAAFVQKIFVINFITSYLPIFLTAFVYVPFGKALVPYLGVYQTTAQRLAGEAACNSSSSSNNNSSSNSTAGEHAAAAAAAAQFASFRINPDRLRQQVIYFTVTAQIVNFATEVIVPYAKRKVFKAVKDVSEEIAHRNTPGEAAHQVQDAPEEAAFLKRVRAEAALDVYDVTIDYREMVVQFGYLSLFSVIWPLTACSFVVNNWVEARSDAVKIAVSSQRPIPWRGDSIGPWLTSLGFLSWLGSLTSAAVVYLFRHAADTPTGEMDIRGWALLLSILCAEHLYLVVQLVVRYVIDKVDSPGLKKERAERFALRKRALAEALGASEAETAVDTSAASATSARSRGPETITRASLEAEARRLSTKGEGSPAEMFWLHQRGPSDSIQIGRALISEFAEKSKAATSSGHGKPSAGAAPEKEL